MWQRTVPTDPAAAIVLPMSVAEARLSGGSGFTTRFGDSQ
jgi:hypothetical protein